jgi:hypothetical protein
VRHWFSIYTLRVRIGAWGFRYFREPKTVGFWLSIPCAFYAAAFSPAAAHNIRVLYPVPPSSWFRLLGAIKTDGFVLTKIK